MVVGLKTEVWDYDLLFLELPSNESSRKAWQSLLPRRSPSTKPKRLDANNGRRRQRICSTQEDGKGRACTELSTQDEHRWNWTIPNLGISPNSLLGR